MKKIMIVVIALVCATSLCYAQGNNSQKANEPVGAVVEATGFFVGTVSSVAVETATGGAVKCNVTVSDENGQTKIFPVDESVKVVDATFNALTLNQLKKGESVSVEYSGDKAKSIKVEK